MRDSRLCLLAVFSASCAPLLANIAAAQVTVVNVIPKEWSWETYNNSEPHLAVNHAQSKWLTAAAWMHNEDWCAGAQIKPLLRSYDRGQTWQSYCALPVDAADTRAGDVTLAYAPSGGRLYAAYLSPVGGAYGAPSLSMRVSRTSQYLWAFGAPMTVIHRRGGGDQPSIKVVDRSGTETAFIGNLFANSPDGYSTAIVDVLPASNTGSMSGNGTFSGYQLVNLNDRDISFDPGTRLATHPNGTVFAAFYRGYSDDATGAKKDVVVAAANETIFSTIAEQPPSGGNVCNDTDGRLGVRVVKCVSVFADYAGTAFGFQRLTQSDISIAVDPSTAMPMNVYVAWADGANLGQYTIHVRRSTNGGLWFETQDLRTIPHATNPALAVDSDGTVGLLYQELSGTCAGGNRWITRLELSRDAFDTEPTSYTLANVPADTPLPQGHPYIGDYIGLEAFDGRFYGVFSTSNKPIASNFPQGVVYGRSVDWTAGKLRDVDGSGDVPESLDPFFFTLRTSEALGCTTINNAHLRAASFGTLATGTVRAMACRSLPKGPNMFVGGSLVDLKRILVNLGC